jgi:hypothetical protein
MPQKYEVGDWIIYRKQKSSSNPGPRAEDLQPAPRGEDYTYHVDKFWTVVEIQEDGKILARTRRGKEHLIDPDDPALRKPRWWEKLLWKNRFPTVASSGSTP